MNFIVADLKREIGTVLKRARRQVMGKWGRVQTSEPSWRKADHGPLAGNSFQLPSGLGAEWAERFIQGQYETSMLRALGELAKRGGVLYDIGAHMGYYACAWLALGGERVEAFEPAPFNRRVLEETLAYNHLSDRVRVHGMALGNTNGQATLVISEADIGAASAAYLDQTGGTDTLSNAGHSQLPDEKRVRVQVCRLDDFVLELDLPLPAVLKIDVEGTEADVLTGAEWMTTQYRPAVLCEVHNVEGGMEIAHRLTKLDYDLTILGKNGKETACMWLPR